MSRQFTLDLDGFRGTTFNKVTLDDLTWAEAEDIERVTGLDSIYEATNTAPVMLAFLWIAVRRQLPKTTYAEMRQQRMHAPNWLPEQDAKESPPDPPPAGGDRPSRAGETSDSATSDSSPSGSGYGPGNGTS